MMTPICSSASLRLTITCLTLLAVTGCGDSQQDELQRLVIQQQTLQQKKQLVWEEVQHLRTLVDSKRDLVLANFDTVMLLTSQASSASPADKQQAEDRVRQAIARNEQYDAELSATLAKLEDRSERYLELEEQAAEVDKRIITLLEADG